MSIILDALKRIQKTKTEKQQGESGFGNNPPWLTRWRAKWVIQGKLKLVLYITLSLMALTFLLLYSEIRNPKSEIQNPKPVSSALQPAPAQQKSLSEDSVKFMILDEKLYNLTADGKIQKEEPQTAVTTQDSKTQPIGTEGKSEMSDTVSVTPEQVPPLFGDKRITEGPSKEITGAELNRSDTVTETQGEKQINIQLFTTQEVTEHFNLALLYQKENKLKEACEAYKRVLELDPSNSQAYNNIGMVYYSLGMPFESMQHYKKAISIDPKYDKSHHNLAIAYYAQGDLEKATMEFAQAILCNPKNPESYNNLGLVYKKKNKPDQAKKILQKGLSTASYNFAPLHYNLAVILEEENGNNNEAAFHYKKFVELSGDNQQDLVIKVKKHLMSVYSYEN